MLESLRNTNINQRFLGAGVGFGGACFHKDVNAITKWSRSMGYTSKILEAVLERNDLRAIRIVDIAEGLIGKLDGKKIIKDGKLILENIPEIKGIYIK